MYTKLIAIILLVVVIAVLATMCLIDGAKKTGLVLCFLGIGVAILAITLITKNFPLNVEVIEVTAIVSDKEYKEETSSLIPIRVGKVTSYNKRTKPEQYLVTVYYNGITEIIDSKELYNAVEEGDEVKVFLKMEYNKHQALLTQELVFE